jgi:lipid-A-disaccharide synthase
MTTRVMVIAGEASGDLHGAGLVRELKALDPAVQVFGIGGDKMSAAGMELVYHVRELSFMGFLEVLKHLPLIRSVKRTLEQLLRLKRPDAVVLIDYPGFNLRFARTVKARAIPVLYYISPQVWAWHRSRVKTMKRVVDRMMVVFRFEVPIYEKEGVPVEFVGHPLLEVLSVSFSEKDFRARFGMDGQRRILALLPGSRVQEIETMLPVMLDAGKQLARLHDMELAVGVAPNLSAEFFTERFDLEGVHLVQNATYELMQFAHFALVTSGTATLETACFGTPMCVLYKTSWPTYVIGRLLVNVRNIGLANIVAGKTVVPEFVQHDMNAKKITAEVGRLLADASSLATMRKELAALRAMLGSPGASRRVAEQVLKAARPS